MIIYFEDLIILISYRTTLIVLWILHRFLSTLSRALCLHITFSAHVFLYMRVNEWVKHLHDRIISLRREVRAHKTSLTPPLVIEVSVPRQESERLYICVLGVSISSFTCFKKYFLFSTILGVFDFLVFYCLVIYCLAFYCLATFDLNCDWSKQSHEYKYY